MLPFSTAKGEATATIDVVERASSTATRSPRGRSIDAARAAALSSNGELWFDAPARCGRGTRSKARRAPARAATTRRRAARRRSRARGSARGRCPHSARRSGCTCPVRVGAEAEGGYRARVRARARARTRDERSARIWEEARTAPASTPQIGGFMYVVLLFGGHAPSA